MSEPELKDTALRLLMDAPRIEECVKRYAIRHQFIVYEFEAHLTNKNQYYEKEGVWDTVLCWTGQFNFNITAKHQMRRLAKFIAWLKDFGMINVRVVAHTVYFVRVWKW